MVGTLQTFQEMARGLARLSAGSKSELKGSVSSGDAEAGPIVRAMKVVCGSAQHFFLRTAKCLDCRNAFLRTIAMKTDH